MSSHDPRDPSAILRFYGLGREDERLTTGDGRLEFDRTRRVLARVLPAAPARILDVGGGTGRYAAWLAEAGYDVVLVDPAPLHVEQARHRADGRFAVEQGDARRLAFGDASFDAVIALGPLYHLLHRDERVGAIAEARRVVRPGGVVVAAAISRLASVLDGIRSRFTDPAFWAIVDRDLRDGRHLPGEDGRYFTAAYFHRPDDLLAEAADAGLADCALVAVEGPAWLLGDLDARLAEPDEWSLLLDAIERIEREADAFAASSHLLLVGRRPTVG